KAERGISELMDSVDTTIVIPNEKLLAVAQDAGFFESFRVADDILRQGVQGISDIITIPGIINRDFADVKTTMAGMGYAVMGTAIGKGERRANDAAQAAIASPLLEAGAIDGARGILINITGSSSLKLAEVNEASTIIQSAAHEEANIIFGAVLDEKMKEEVKITVIATGFKEERPHRRERIIGATIGNLPARSSHSSSPVVNATPHTERVNQASLMAERAGAFSHAPEPVRPEPPKVEVAAPEAPRYPEEPAPKPLTMSAGAGEPLSGIGITPNPRPQPPAPLRETSLDAVKNAVNNVEQDD